MIKTFKPFYDKIQIEPIEKDSLLMQSNNMLEAGKVISVGSKVKFVKTGDIVFFASHGFEKTTEMDGRQYFIVPEHSEFIQGKYENGSKRK